jgi:hypothetical protein
MDDDLKRFRRLPRHIHYEYIGDGQPSTGFASPRTNPDEFVPHEGFPTIFSGLMQLVSDIDQTVEEMSDDDQSNDVQSSA